MNTQMMLTELFLVPLQIKGQEIDIMIKGLEEKIIPGINSDTILPDNNFNIEILMTLRYLIKYLLQEEL